MMLRRIALFFAMLFGLATTQLPEFMQQYRQRLGGAIDEINAIVTRFDGQAKDLGLSENAGISQLEHNADPLVKARGEDMERLVARLANLRRSASALDNPNAFARWASFATTADARIAARAYEAYQPAVPTTTDGFIAGLVGFVIGGGLIHLLSLPIKHGHKLFRRRQSERIDYA